MIIPSPLPSRFNDRCESITITYVEPEPKPSQEHAQEEGTQVPLDYVPMRQRRGLRALAWKGLSRLNRPISLGAYYVIMLVLGVVGTIIAFIIVVIMRLLG